MLGWVRAWGVWEFPRDRFLGGLDPGAVVMTWMRFWCLLGGVFLAAAYSRAGGGSVLVDMGYWPGILAAGVGLRTSEVLGQLRLRTDVLAGPWVLVGVHFFIHNTPSCLTYI